MKKIIQKINAVLQMVLLAPVKLPGKSLNIFKCIALGLGIVETVLDAEQKKKVDGNTLPENIPDLKEESDET